MPIATSTFRQFPNRVLIETGTAGGEGTTAALEASCFEEIYTIELFPTSFYAAAAHFANWPNVHTLFGPSPDNLVGLLATLHEPMTFWLDAHGDPSHPSAGLFFCPLMDELRVLAMHDVRTHTILIDDVHLFGRDLPGEPEVLQRLRDINPDYVISLAPSLAPELGLDILVARPA